MNGQLLLLRVCVAGIECNASYVRGFFVLSLLLNLGSTAVPSCCRVKRKRGFEMGTLPLAPSTEHAEFVRSLQRSVRLRPDESVLRSLSGTRTFQVCTWDFPP